VLEGFAVTADDISNRSSLDFVHSNVVHPAGIVVYNHCQLTRMLDLIGSSVNTLQKHPMTLVLQRHWLQSK
jgi:hypothetical protein